MKYKIVGRKLHFVLSGNTAIYNGETYYQIRFWEIREKKETSERKYADKHPNSINIDDNSVYYYLAEKDLKTQAVERYSTNVRSEIGVAVILFRYRFGRPSKGRHSDIEFNATSPYQRSALNGG